MRQQLIDQTRPLRGQTREHVLQISIYIMSIQSRRLDHNHDRRRRFSAAQRSGEESVLASKSPWPDLILTPIVFYGDDPIIQVARQRCPALQAVIQHSNDGRTLGHQIALGDHAGMQPTHHLYRFSYRIWRRKSGSRSRTSLSISYSDWMYRKDCSEIHSPN